MFTIQEVKNLFWADQEHTVFVCDVKYKEFNEIHNTGVSATEPYEHMKELWAKGTTGEYGVIAEFVPIPQPAKIGSVPPEQQPQTSGSQTL